MPTGEGYHLCTDICKQWGHAETQAIAKAREDGVMIIGSTLYLEGHTYVCSACQAACDDAGIAHVIIGSPPA